MHLAAAFAAGHLAARATDRRFRASETEIRAAHERVLARRAALAAPSAPPAAHAAHSAPTRAPREYPERGRHAAPRPA